VDRQCVERAECCKRYVNGEAAIAKDRNSGIVEMKKALE
jgi:hypothetical protein